MILYNLNRNKVVKVLSKIDFKCHFITFWTWSRLFFCFDLFGISLSLKIYNFFRIEMNEIFIKILRSSSDTPLNGKPIKIIVTWLVFVSRDVHALLKYTKCTFYKFTMVCNSCIKTTLKWRHHDVTSLDSQLYHVGHCHCPGRQFLPWCWWNHFRFWICTRGIGWGCLLRCYCLLLLNV